MMVNERNEIAQIVYKFSVSEEEQLPPGRLYILLLCVCVCICVCVSVCVYTYMYIYIIYTI